MWQSNSSVSLLTIVISTKYSILCAVPGFSDFTGTTESSLSRVHVTGSGPCDYLRSLSPKSHMVLRTGSIIS